MTHTESHFGIESHPELNAIHDGCSWLPLPLTQRQRKELDGAIICYLERDLTPQEESDLHEILHASDRCPLRAIYRTGHGILDGFEIFLDDGANPANLVGFLPESEVDDPAHFDPNTFPWSDCVFAYGCTAENANTDLYGPENILS